MKNCYIVFSFLMVCGFCIPFASPASGLVVQSYPEAPLFFTVNKGQTDQDIRFTSRASGCDFFLGSSGATLLLNRETEASRAKRAAQKSVVFANANDSMIGEEHEYHTLKLRFLGANENPEMTGEEKLTWNSNYFIGNDPSRWKTDVPNYSKVRCHDLYPGVDMVWYGRQNRLKYDLIIQPGKDISKITLSCIGASGMAVNAAGDLEAETPLGKIVEKKPYSYQEIEGKRKEIAVRYIIRDSSAGTYGFAVESYDSRYPLVIDPELVYSTFLGGTGVEGQTKIAVDASGCMYLAGVTRSLDFPATPGAYNSTISDTRFGDIFVTKFDPSGKNILFSTYIHGGDAEELRQIIVDDTEDIFLAGETRSIDFPRTPGAFSTPFDQNYQRAVFVTKLSKQGNALVYSSVFGETLKGWETIYFGLDGYGCAYISAYGTITPTSGCLQETSQDHYGDLRLGQFICKLSEDGSRLLYATYYGGTDNVYSLDGFAVDWEGNVLLAGTAGKNFPITAKSLCDSILPPGYLCKINPEGSKLVFSTFLFGENPRGLTVDKDGFIYLLTTFGSKFPITPGAYLSSKGIPAILCKLCPEGDRFVFSARAFIIGGYLTTDIAGRIFLYGRFDSPPPVTIDAFKQTVTDLYFCAVDPTGSSLLYGTYLGGSSNDLPPGGIATDNQGNVYLSGATFSTDFPTTEGAYDRINNGGDAFFCKFSFGLSPTQVEDAPRAFHLSPARPNPFNPATTISFTLPQADRAELAVYSITGQRVRTLHSGPLSAGTHSFVWNGRDESGKPVSSGLYLSRLTSGKQTATGKMLLLK